MRISTKGRYAVRMMVCLAQQGEGVQVSLKEVAAQTGISKKYLEQIAPNLSSAQLVRSVRGASGGYRLARAASRISIKEILEVTEGPLSPVDCLDGGVVECQFNAPCPELFVWQGLQRRIEDYLGSVSLQDVLDTSTQIAIDSYTI